MNIKNILITGGRAPATLFLIRKLHHAGCRIITAESCDYYIAKYSACVSACYKVISPVSDTEKFIDEITGIVKKEKIDLIIPTCEEIFYLSKGKQTLEQYCRVFCDEQKKLLELHNKWSFYEKIRDSYTGVKLPRSAYVENAVELEEFIKGSGSGNKFVIKPVYSRFAARVMITDSVPDNFVPGRYIVQEFIEGEQICSYSVIRNHRILLHSDYRTVYAAGKGATIAFQYEDNRRIYDFIEEFSRKEDFFGQIAFDFIQNDTGLYLIECNPRLTSGIQLFDESRDISGVFTGEGISETVYPDRGYRTALIMIMFMYIFANVHSCRELRAWWHTIVSSEDVIYDKRDIKPFFMQFAVLIMVLFSGFRKHVGLKEMSTYDIEYNGDD
ncbi:MAG: ATP-grasp domain-containing protein [Ruminobacter sp.]|nr:ATP-grasp domain-containing protein [Ruminobacter sp.]